MSKLIPLTKGYSAIVDDADYDILNKYKWYASKCGSKWYARTSTHGEHSTFMHRLLMNAQKGETVDHIDDNGLNNQRSNIRILGHGANIKRSSRVRGASGIKGVYQSSYSGWIAQRMVNGRREHYGTFATIDEAAAALPKE